MLFLSSFHEKKSCDFLLPGNSALKIFAVKDEKISSQIWWCYSFHPNKFIFGTIKCLPSLQEKDADLQDRFVETQLSPKRD